MSKVDEWMPLYVGPYLADTGHLSTAEHGAYLLLMMHAWRNEGALPNDPERLRSITRMQPAAWRKSWPTLRQFFEGFGDTLTQKRLTKELNKARLITDQRSEAGKASAAKRWGNGKGNETGNEMGNKGITNDQQNGRPIQSSLPSSLQTSLPEPSSSPSPQQVQNSRARKRAAIRPDGVSEQVWGDFIVIRKAKRAPLTDTALSGIEREAGKAGMTLQAVLEMACARGWQSFKAEWLNGSKQEPADVKEQARRRIFGDEKDITHEAERL